MIYTINKPLEVTTTNYRFDRREIGTNGEPNLGDEFVSKEIAIKLLAMLKLAKTYIKLADKSYYDMKAFAMIEKAITNAEK